jgi:enamine deaminase RidA (YjgF/YER057c/UK114 family)
MTNRFVPPREGSARAGLGSDVVLGDGWGFVTNLQPIDLDDDKVPLPEMIEAQTRKILANLETLLAPLGLGKDNVVKVEIAMVDIPRLYDRMNKAWRGFFAAERQPARSCIGVASLPRGALIQMNFTLRVPAG